MVSHRCTGPCSCHRNRDELVDIMNASEQSEWCADPHGFNMRDVATLKPMVRAQETKYSTAARKFREQKRSRWTCAVVSGHIWTTEFALADASQEALRCGGIYPSGPNDSATVDLGVNRHS